MSNLGGGGKETHRRRDMTLALRTVARFPAPRSRIFPGFSPRRVAIGASVFWTIPAKMWSHRNLSSSSASLRAVAPSYAIFWNPVVDAAGSCIAARRNWSLLCRSQYLPLRSQRHSRCLVVPETLQIVVPRSRFRPRHREAHEGFLEAQRND